MQCVLCKRGETAPGHTTVTLTRDALTVVIRGVPADVCANCGESYVADAVAAELLERLDQAEAAGSELAVQNYRAPQPAKS
ncbi:MAG: type II toxin-antitoxin system MqsA family antitoxin [Pirellulales bacterium]